MADILRLATLLEGEPAPQHLAGQDGRQATMRRLDLVADGDAS